MSKIAECDECGAKWDARIFEGDHALAECPKCVEHAYFKLRSQVPVVARMQRIEEYASRILTVWARNAARATRADVHESAKSALEYANIFVYEVDMMAAKLEETDDEGDRDENPEAADRGSC
jgi:hypothetical protein